MTPDDKSVRALTREVRQWKKRAARLQAKCDKLSKDKSAKTLRAQLREMQSRFDEVWRDRCALLESFEARIAEIGWSVRRVRRLYGVALRVLESHGVGERDLVLAEGHANPVRAMVRQGCFLSVNTRGGITDGLL